MKTTNAEDTKREKARKLRYKKPIMSAEMSTEVSMRNYSIKAIGNCNSCDATDKIAELPVLVPGRFSEELNERKIPYNVENNEMIVSQKAYNIKKVIDQLEDMKKEMENKGLYPTAMGYRQVIEIVKNGLDYVKLKEKVPEQQLKGWISIDERLPDTDDYILLSFSNFTNPLVGRYETDKDGSGAFYIGDELETCLSQNIFVNAWQPLPEPFKED